MTTPSEHDEAEAGGWAERLVDELVPDGVEWRRLVSRYPRSTVVGAAVAGFVLGRSRGLSLAAALSGFVIGEVSHGLENAAHSLQGLRDELDPADGSAYDDSDDR
ncbi:MAG: hypothetical protein AAGC60_10515 [Acidobacteriota bacterium]